MPHYKVADPCVWDLAVAVTISVAIWWASREGKNLEKHVSISSGALIEANASSQRVKCHMPRSACPR
jgi:hypothetical protein